MRVFVVLGGWDHEGYDQPIGVYSTKELAEEAKKREAEKKSLVAYDAIIIVERELDAFMKGD